MTTQDEHKAGILKQIRDSLARLELQAMPLEGSPSVRSLAAAVRAELARSGKTRAELAIAIGRSRPNLKDKLVGNYPFRTDELAKAAALLDCTVLELMQSALRAEAKAAVQVPDVLAGLDRRKNVYEQPPRAAAATRRQAERTSNARAR